MRIDGRTDVGLDGQTMDARTDGGRRRGNMPVMNERTKKLDDRREDGRTSDGQTMDTMTDVGWTADRRTDERAEVRTDGWKNCQTFG